MTETIEDAEYAEVGTDLELRPAQSATLFDTTDPDEALARATGIATALQKVLKQAKLTVNIGRNARPYVLAEGWTCLGSLVGVFPRTVWTRQLENGWEARVDAVTRDGAVVGSAESQCTRAERIWAGRDDFALRSMAQTRAMSKALRMPLGFIVVLAGFEATPADEMPVLTEPVGHGGRGDPVTSRSEIRDEHETPSGSVSPGQTVVTFGKYKGKTIAEVADLDRQYVGWIAHESSNEKIKAAALAFLHDEDIPF